MLRRSLLLSLSSIFLLSLSLSAHAATLASWDTFGLPGNQATTPGAGSANVTALDLTRGADLNPTNGNNSMNSNGWSGSDPGDYFEFGLSIDVGYQADLTELIIGTRSSNTGPGTIGVYTNQDGFSSAVATIIQPGNTFVNSVIDLTSLGTVTGDLILRLIEIGDTQADGVGATSGGGTFRVVDFFDGSDFSDSRVEGTVSLIPEPGTALLVGLGLVGLGVTRRSA